MPRRNADFNGQHVLNDIAVEVLEVCDDFAKIRPVAEPTADEGGDDPADSQRGALARVPPLAVF